MTETPFSFGPDSRLVGILTTPDGPVKVRAASLLFNAGVLPRVGPHRINVKLARALAAKGVPSLRMDLSGLGDSRPAPGTSSHREQTLSDLRAGMALIRRETGLNHCLSIGICSGAFNGYQLALAEPRVAGVLMYNGYAFPTLGTYIRLRWRQLRRTPLLEVPGAVLRVTREMAQRVRPLQAETAEVPETVSKAEFQAGIERLIRRGVSVFIAYSGSLAGLYNHPTQLADSFGNAEFIRHIRLAYLPHLDHTLTSLEAQREFINLTCDWAVQVAASDRIPGENASEPVTDSRLEVESRAN